MVPDRSIDVYADVWCPFAHVGLLHLTDRLGALRLDDVAVRVRAWPLELVNDAPEDPAATAEHIAALRAQVAPDLFVGFDAARFPHTSLPALQLASGAYEHSCETGLAVSLALRHALFEEGLDISAPEVLRDVARRHGLDADPLPGTEDAVRREWEEGQSRHVQGSPHFFCGELSAFCPSLDIEDHDDGDGGELRVRPDPAALDDFLSACSIRA